MKRIILFLGLLSLPIITLAQPIGYCDPGPCMLSESGKNFLIAHNIFIFIIVISVLICLVYLIGLLGKRKIISRSKFFISIAFLCFGIIGIYIIPQIKGLIEDHNIGTAPCIPGETSGC